MNMCVYMHAYSFQDINPTFGTRIKIKIFLKGKIIMKEQGDGHI